MFSLVGITSEERDEIRIGEAMKCQKYGNFALEGGVVGGDLLTRELEYVSDSSGGRQSGLAT